MNSWSRSKLIPFDWTKPWNAGGNTDRLIKLISNEESSETHERAKIRFTTVAYEYALYVRKGLVVEDVPAAQGPGEVEPVQRAGAAGGVAAAAVGIALGLGAALWTALTL